METLEKVLRWVIGVGFLWLYCLPVLAVIGYLIYRRMGQSVGGDSSEEWKLLHQAQDMKLDRIKRDTKEILRNVQDNAGKNNERTQGDKPENSQDPGSGDDCERA